MNYTLKNNGIAVEFTTAGGSYTSVKDAAGLEYLWQADPAYWKGQAPIMFPICGSIRNDEAMLSNGKTIRMGRHGIIRKREWEMMEQTDTTIVFRKTSDEETLAAFPFAFEFYSRYELLDKGLKVTYEVVNTGDEVMPFFVGGHPAFNCPLTEGEDFSDYLFEFETEETCEIPTPVVETGLLDVEHRTLMLDHTKTLRLDHSLFKLDSVLLDTVKSRAVKWYSEKSGKGLYMTYPDFEIFNIWSSNNDGPFVALEPWTGCSTTSAEDDIFEHKFNVKTLAPNESRSFTYTFTFLD